MNSRDIQTEEFSRRVKTYCDTRKPSSPAWSVPRALTRRQFLGAAAGATVLGATLGAGLWRPQVAAADDGRFDPVPIPGGSPVLGGGFHLFGPAAIDPIDAEPSSITNFKGSVGLAYISGMVKRTNMKTGEVRMLPFMDADMRFMKGVFRGKDGRIHEGEFGFVWVDVYEPGPGSQIHDLNPSLFPPTGLFWTLQLPDDSIEVEPEEGAALVRAKNVPIFDYRDIPNALFGGLNAVPGTVSFKIKWSGVKERLKIRNTDPIYGGFTGSFVRNSAQMEWTARVGDYMFVSAPLATSTSSFAEIGKERNGSFFT